MLQETMIQDRILPRRWTRQEFEQLGSLGFFEPEERLELLDGEIFRMTPQSSWHATAVSLATRIAFSMYRRGYVIRVQMPLAVDANSLPEPDVAIVSGVEADYRDAHPSTAVLVIEVADATLFHDRKLKQRIYARAGIPEYWLINLSDYCLEVFRNPAAEGFQYHLTLAPAESIAPLTHPRRTIAVRNLLP
jgi:Uma2 family endonuclease